MHVLVISEGMPLAKNPLFGIFAWDQAMALSKAGIEVDFFAVDLRSFRRIRPWGIRHGKKDGIRWHSISIPIGAIPALFLCKLGTIALRSLYRNVFKSIGKSPDIMHAHFTESGYMASELANEEKIPLVITEHSSKMVQSVIPKDLRSLAEWGYQRADCVIAVSSFLQKCIYQHTGIIAEIVPNVVSAEFYCARERHGGVRFISVSHLNKGKRIDILIKAFAFLAAGYNDVILEIVGDGDQRTNLQRLAEKLNISTRVNFHGLLSRKEIGDLYRSCDCFVLPSAFETFGVAYIEAMAAGLPVIATRCGGPEDFVTEENGILVDVDDEDGLMEAMLAMYSSLEKYDCNLIATTAMERFSPFVIAERLLSIYEKVLKSRK